MIKTKETAAERPVRDEGVMRGDEDRYRILVENSPDGIAYAGLDARIVFANTRLAQMHGYAHAREMTGRNIFDLIVPGDRPQAAAHLKALIEAGKPFDIHYTALRNDGSRFPAGLSASVARDGRGRAAGLAVVVRDISELERREEALRESEERYRDLFETSPDGISLADMNGKIIFANTRTATMHGYGSAREIIGKNVTEFIDPSSRKKVLQDLDQALAHGPQRNRRYLMLRKDGSTFSGELSISVLKDGRGEPGGFIGVSRDISDREAMEEKVRESEERFKLFFSRSPVGLAIIDRDMRFVTVNDILAGYNGISAQAHIGKTVREVLAQKAGLVEPLIRKVFATGEPIVNYESSLPLRPEEIYFSSSFFPLSGAGGSVANVGVIVVDLTDRKRMENELQRNQRFVERIVATTPNLIHIFDLDRRASVFSNLEVTKTLGYSSADLHRRGDRFLTDFLYPDDREKLFRHFEDMRRAKDGEVVEIEYRMRCADGSWRWIRSRDAVFARNPDGTVTQVIGTGTDVTDQKQAGARLETAVHLAEQRAREAEEGKRTLDALMQNTPEGILVVEAPERTVRRISRYGREFIGFERGETMGMGLDRLLDRLGVAADGSRDAGSSLLQSVLSEGTEIINREFTFAADGRQVVTLVNAGPIRDKEGKITGAVFTWQDITERKKDQERIKQGYRRLEKVTNGIIASISRVVEMRDPYTAGHQRRVGQLAFAIAKGLGFSADRANGIRIAGLIHDIGKLNVPAEILSKPVRLSITEFEIIKIHPQAGYDILSFIDFPWPVAEVAYQHQERLDGSGYPRQLKGDEILPETKVVSVADTVEAMTFPRPYRPLVGLEKALAEIEANRGVLFDPDAVDVCLRLFREKKFEFEK